MHTADWAAHLDERDRQRRAEAAELDAFYERREQEAERRRKAELARRVKNISGDTVGPNDVQRSRLHAR
jgi:hypothetical protein